MKIFLASGNEHKVRELQALAEAAGLAVSILSAAAAGGRPAVAEDAGTFAGNAAKKARALRRRLPAGSWVLADDSGLCVDALGGGPGVESANYAGPAADAGANLAKLVRELRDVPEGMRGAHFLCVLLVAGPDGREAVFEGRCDGHLLREPRGTEGFGYDPLFVPAGFDASFAELGAAVKGAISHRSQAWNRLAAWLRAQSPE